MVREFKLAPMDLPIWILTAIMLALPAVFLVAAFTSFKPLAGPAGLVIAIYLWIWLRFRPTSFTVTTDRVEINWPLKTRHIGRSEILSADIIDRKQLKEKVGLGFRVGAGGLWGGFGWLWTTKLGIVQMYISRTDRFVFLTLKNGRPWLITSELPEQFVNSLSM